MYNDVTLCILHHGLCFLYYNFAMLYYKIPISNNVANDEKYQ